MCPSLTASTPSSAPLTFGPGPTARTGSVPAPLQRRPPQGYPRRRERATGRRRAASARRAHGIRPKRSLGQHFLIGPNLARAIATDVGVGPGDRVVEIGAGLGSLTRALAETGADVVAIEVDDALLPALRESVSG